jgi:hypothetical protein
LRQQQLVEAPLFGTLYLTCPGFRYGINITTGTVSVLLDLVACVGYS